jgi:hypothetical protein
MKKIDKVNTNNLFYFSDNYIDNLIGSYYQEISRLINYKRYGIYIDKNFNEKIR